MIRGVFANEAFARWDEIAPVLQRVFDRFDIGITTDNLLQDILTRDMQLWDCGSGYAITQIVIKPNFKVLTIPYIAGDGMDEWLGELFETVKAFGQSNGCKYLEGYGRKGWQRRLESFGFAPYAITVRCEIDGRKE